MFLTNAKITHDPQSSRKTLEQVSGRRTRADFEKNRFYYSTLVPPNMTTETPCFRRIKTPFFELRYRPNERVNLDDSGELSYDFLD